MKKFGDFIFIVKDPDPHWPNFEDPDPLTINTDPQHCLKIIMDKVSWFLMKCFSSFLSFLWSLNICSITHFVGFSTPLIFRFLQEFYEKSSEREVVVKSSDRDELQSSRTRMGRRDSSRNRTMVRRDSSLDLRAKLDKRKVI